MRTTISKTVIIAGFLAMLFTSSAFPHFLFGFHYCNILSQSSANFINKKVALDDEYVPEWYDMFLNIPRDIGRYTDVTFRTNKIPLYAGVAAFTIALVAADDAIYTTSHRWYKNSNSVMEFSDVATYIGDGRTQFGLAAGFLAFGIVAGNKRALRTASQVTEVILASGLVVQVLKHITGRESPRVRTTPSGRWDLFPNQIEYHKHVPHYDAFPSGHLTTWLATVIVIAENYPEQSWIRPVGYTLAGLLAIGMGNSGIHWYSDYPLAIVFGYTFGMIASHPEGIPLSLLGSDNSAQLYVVPTFINQNVGLWFSCIF